MKKFVSLFLTFLLLLTSVSVTVFGETETETIEIILSNVVGFSDNSGNDVLEYDSSTGTVCLRQSEWVKYDISGNTKGYYNVYAELSNKYDITLGTSIDSDGTACSVTIPSSTDYLTYNEVLLGSFKVTEDTNLEIAVENKASTYIKRIWIEVTPFGDEIEIIPSSPSEFYDGGGAGTLETSGTTVILATHDWVKYDVSGNVGGRYKVYAEVANRYDYVLNTSFDLPDSLSRVTIPGTGDKNFNTYQEVCLGLLSLTEDTTTLKIESQENLAVYIRKIWLELIPYTYEFEITEDEEGTVEADRLSGHDTLYLTGSFDNSLYGAETIKVFIAYYDENGRLLSVVPEEIETVIEEKTLVSIPIDVRNDAYKLKVLMWEDFEDALPLLSEKSVYLGDSDTHYFVSASAKVNGNGSENSPFNTIEAAKEYVKTINKNMTGDIYVHLSGDFEIDDTLEFTAEDSGTNRFSVIYQGDGEASISGGKKISGFTSVSGTPLYKVSVENDNFRQLYVNGNRAQRARSKWLYFAKSAYDDPNVDYRSVYVKDEVTKEYIINPDGVILDGADFPDGFSKPQYMEMVWMPSWRNVRMPIESITENADGDLIVTCPQPYFNSIFTSSAGVEIDSADPHVFYLENAPEFLDEPGEWYCNKDTNELFYYPLDGEDMASAEIYIPYTEKLLSLYGTDEDRIENITFSGIEFKYGAWNRTTQYGFSTIQAEQLIVPEKMTEGDTTYPTEMMPAQISVDYGRKINFIDNKFLHMGSVALSLDNKTEKSKIEGNLFDDTSAAAITVSNDSLPFNAQPDEMCRNIDIENNLIRRPAVEYMDPAITVCYANNINIVHNDISDCPYTGISFGWGWSNYVQYCSDSRIASNKIENVLYKLRDGAHIYTLSRNDNTVIENNYLIKSGHWKGGIYFDAGSKNYTVRNNVVEDCLKWLKATTGSVISNTATNNYADSGYGITVTDSLDVLSQNDIETEIRKENGAWPDGANAIIAGAGLEAEYSHLLTEYNANTNYRNVEIARMPFITLPGIIVAAGDLIPGGEGVAWYDLSETTNPVKQGVGIYDTTNGTGFDTIGNTKQGEWTKHSVTVSEGGTYRLYLNAAATSEDAKVNVWVNGEKIKPSLWSLYTGDITNTGDYSIFQDNDLGTVTLTEGENIIKVEHAVGNFMFHSLRFVKTDAPEFSRNDGFIAAYIQAINGSN